MSDEITKDLFEHLVELAALELKDDEAAYLRKELNNQLAAIRILQGIPLSEDIEAAARGVAYPADRRAPIREDVVINCEERDAILLQAPELEDGYIVVPEIPQEELK